MKRRRERLTFDFKSIKFKTWLYFMLLSFVVLGMLWVVQIVFFNTGYRAMKVSEIRRTGDKMAEILADRTSLPPNFQQIANDYAAANGVAVMIARRETDGNLFHVLGYAGTLGIADETENESDFINLLFPDGTADVLDRLDASDGSVCYSDTLGDAGEFIVYGARVSGAADMMYVFMLSPVRQSEAAVVVMMDQLLICTVICLFLSIILTYFVANHLSRPIVRFSQVASRLGQGDYSVRFEGNGFTEIDELADTLNYATEEMGKTESLRRDFLANVSHDLRTPLTMVKAYAEMIRDISGNNREKREEHAQVIIDEADRLAALVEDIQNLSKLQSGTVALEKSEFDLGALTRTVIERFGVMAERDRLRVPYGDRRRRDRHGRFQAHRAGAVQPHRQRRQLHRRGQDGHGARADRQKRQGAVRGDRHRQGHSGRRDSARVGQILPRQHDQAQRGGVRTGPVHREKHSAAARRRVRHLLGSGEGLDLLVPSVNGGYVKRPGFPVFFRLRHSLMNVRARRLFGALAHDRDAVGNAAVVAVEYALGRAVNFRVHRVIGGDEIAARLEVDARFVLVVAVREAVGVAVYGDLFGAAAVALVVNAAFESAF